MRNMDNREWRVPLGEAASSRSPYRRIEAAAVMVLLAVLGLVSVLPEEAWAYGFTGCKYDEDSISPISYKVLLGRQ